MLQRFLSRSERTQTVPAYMVTLQHILLVVANRFRLPIEKGLDIKTIPHHLTDVGALGGVREDPNRMTVSVSAPEWGPTSGLVLNIERGENTGLWYPVPGFITLTLENSPHLPEQVRNMIFHLDIRRRYPEPNKDRAWYQGRYPRFSVRVKTSLKRTDK